MGYSVGVSRMECGHVQDGGMGVSRMGVGGSEGNPYVMHGDAM